MHQPIQAQTFYIVSGFRNGRVRGQWVIAADTAQEARQIARCRHGQLFDDFVVEEDTDRLFDAEENLTEQAAN